jgi:hypothetical protein
MALVINHVALVNNAEVEIFSPTTHTVEPLARTHKLVAIVM